MNGVRNKRILHDPSNRREERTCRWFGFWNSPGEKAPGPRHRVGQVVRFRGQVSPVECTPTTVTSSLGGLRSWVLGVFVTVVVHDGRVFAGR